MEFGYSSLGKYIQMRGMLENVGTECAPIGRKAFILGGVTALSLTKDTLIKSMDNANLDYEIFEFTGQCSPDNIDRYADFFSKSGADFVVGVGGGRTIDAAKGVAYRTDVSVVCVPTTASQCASCANVIILYDDQGDPLPYAWNLKTPIRLTLVDSSFLTTDSPARMLATGLADSLAKKIEIEYLRKKMPNWASVPTAPLAYEFAKYTWDSAFETGIQAYLDAKERRYSEAIETAICSSLLITGLSSSLACGIRQIAFAHNLYYGFCKYHKEIRNRYTHGELVSMGLPLQLMLNGAKQKEIDELVSFLQKINTPVYPLDINLTPSVQLADQLLTYCYEQMPYLSNEERGLMRSSLSKFWKLDE